MTGEILYLLFNITITVLVCYRKKNQSCSEFLHLCLLQGITLDALGSLPTYGPPEIQVQLFIALPKTDSPIFFLYSPMFIIFIFIKCNQALIKYLKNFIVMFVQIFVST